MVKPLYIALLATAAVVASPAEARAKTWYAAQPWLVGSNYAPATAYRRAETDLIRRRSAAPRGVVPIAAMAS